MAEITRMSSRGQVVIPKDIRQDFKEGTTFAVFGKSDTIILKRVEMPTAKQAFECVHEWGVELAKKKGLKETDVMKIIHKGRGIRE